MNNLSRAAAAKLAATAAEIEANRPVPEWDSIPELRKWKEEVVIKGEKKRLTFDEMVVKYKDLDAEIKFRENIKKEIKLTIEAGLLLADVQKCMCEGYRVQVIEKEGAKKIDANKLLDLGVDADVIAAATVQGKSSSYVDIRSVKEPG
jgi:hypothetical protein